MRVTNLLRITNIRFPAVRLVDKYPCVIKRTKNKIQVGKKFLYLKDTMLTSFNPLLINQINTDSVYNDLRDFISDNLNNKGRRLILDSNFKMFITTRKLPYSIFTAKVEKESHDYLMMKNVPYFLRKPYYYKGESYGTCVNMDGIYYLLGYSNKKLNMEGFI